MPNYFEERPWGSFEILIDDPDYKVKRIIVKNGERLSLQYHDKRDEILNDTNENIYTCNGIYTS